MEKIIYSKCSTERRREYKIITSIQEKDGKRTVQKSAANQEARTHVNRMLEYYKMGEIYSLPNVKNAPCRKVKDGCVEFDYIEGESFAEKMENCVEQNNMERLEEYVKRIRDIIVNVSCVEPFAPSEKFERVFGKRDWLKGMDSAKYLNIDLLAENIIESGDLDYIIDYELTFPFSIPIKYVVFRMLFFNSIIASLGTEQKEQIYEMCELPKNEWDRFYEMELMFQSHVSQNALDDVKRKIGMKTFVFSQNNEIIPEKKYKMCLESNETISSGSWYGNELKIEKNVRNEKEIILKLSCKVCSVKILKTSAKMTYSNSSLMMKKDLFFLTKPILKFDVENVDKLELDIQVLNEDNALIEYVIAYANKCKDIETQLLKCGDEINEFRRLIDEYCEKTKQRECLISELGSELARIKSAEGFEKFAKKNNIYEG